MRTRPSLVPTRPHSELPSHEPPVQLCAFLVGSEEYAVDIMRVEEILPPQPLTAMPRAPVYVEGVIQLRGAVLPVVDLRKRLLGPGAPPPSRTRLLICLFGRRRVAVAVDRVTEVVHVRKSEIKPAPPLQAAGQRPFVVGVWGPPARLKLLLDLKALLAADAKGAP
ncbi:purine-binding chemotaxis protein CheW [Aggregicoccus sp. 17bor-14]|uniref:chemotaxis protein CheW n=1 Tax=Myxococcaceae TaxID=31 RepID=UPI00129C8945|nr:MULTISPECIES: chemotaxis protein CheW [Myxococcaceae]MBF5046354.1 purine-binding chemotaxis protein CheW [Simulacricoccus sp. 17bor-14]MRI92074.1 purine-binding chemotaxis protein CheW [Aggregicoccus sp. 17bor-14]